MSTEIFVYISGAPVDIDEEEIEAHFSMKKYGGGKANVVELDDDKIIVSIANLDSDGIQKLLNAEHRLDGTNVNVKQCDSHKMAIFTNPTTESPPQCTVVVKGLTYSDKDDAIDCLELYFGNVKKGGGRIVDGGVKLEKRRAFITFADSKVAEMVVINSPHTVMGQELDVILAKEEHPAQTICNLLLKNVPPGTDIDHLELYVDKVTNLSFTNGDYELLQKEEGVFLIVFKSSLEISMTDILDKISKRKIKKSVIEAEVISPSTSLIISNMDKKRDHEFFELYFTNPEASGISEYDDIEILDDSQVILHLHDQESAQAVMQKTHKKLGSSVQLQLHDRFSNHRSSKDATDKEVNLPKQFHVPVVKRVSCVMAHYVQQHQSSLSELLEQFHVQISFDIDVSSEAGFVHLLPSQGSEMVRNWSEECKAKLEQYLEAITTSSLQLYPQLLPMIQKVVAGKNADKSLCVEFAKDQTVLHIAGHHDEVAKIVEEIRSIEDTELSKEESFRLDKKRIAYISQVYKDTLKNLHPAIHFTINIEENTVFMNGKKDDIVAFKTSLDTMKFVSVSVSVVQEVIHYISSSDDQNFVKKLLQVHTAPVAVFFDQDTSILYILASEKSVASTLVKQIERNIGFVVIKNTTLLERVYEDKQFFGVCNQLKEEFTVDIIVLPSEIKIIGERQHVNKVKLRVNQYMQEEYFGKRKLEVCKGKWRFISEHLHAQWSKIVVNNLEHNPQYKEVNGYFPKVTDDNPVILLEGEELLITSLFQQITTLVDSICTNDPPMIIDRPGLPQFLQSREAEFAIKGIEASVPACIEYTIKIKAATNEIDKTSNEVCRGTTKEGKRIMLVEGNIENFRVDVIVNAANGDLKHHSGVALAISKKGGPKIQRDSNSYIKIHGPLQDGEAKIREEVGDLPCKQIVHVVGPVWKTGQDLEPIKLNRACTNALHLAQKFESVAFPAISSGLYKFPIDLCANTMIQSFCSWSKDFPLATLQDVYIVVHKHAVSAFTDAMKGSLNMVQHGMTLSASANSPPADTASVTPVRRKRRQGNSAGMDTVTSPAIMLSSPSNTQTVPISVFKGELLNEMAEVYVNSTSNDLILTNGAVSKSILNVAGQTVQNECSQFVSQNGRLQPGDIAVTGPGVIANCKHIIHSVGSNYDNSNTAESEKVLKETVQKCLEFCDQNGIASIAFPALGAGNLGYPSNIVARVMISTVQNYYQAKISCIKVVKFVIFMDNTYQEFLSFLSQSTGTTLSKAPNLSSPLPVPSLPSLQSLQSPIINSSYQHSPPLAAPPQSEDLSGVFNTGNLTVEVVCGDITDDDSDVIVNTTLPELQLESGAVSKAISQKAGPSMQQECEEYIKQYKQLRDGNICITDATGSLECKKVFHVTAPGSKKAAALKATVIVCLEKAELSKLQSIAFPAIGTGGLHYKPDTAAQGICEAVIEFGATKPAFLQRVRIVVFQKDMHKKFMQKFIEISTGQIGKPQPSILYRYASAAYQYVSSVGSYLTGGKGDGSTTSLGLQEFSKLPEITTSSSHSPVVQVQVYAESAKAVTEAEDSFLEVINKHCESLPVSDPRIKCLKPVQVLQLTKKATEHHVSIDIDVALSSIKIRGDKNSVRIVEGEIVKTLYEIDKEKLTEEAILREATLLEQQIKWQYRDGSKYEDYATLDNYQIENAYTAYTKTKQNPLFTFKDDQGDQCQIQFNSNPMQEKCNSMNRVSDVRRVDLKVVKHAEYPQSWGSNIGDNTQPKMVPLDAKSAEYTAVKKGFEATVSGKTIVKIERIQNPTLYAQYAVRKRVMDQTNPATTINERRLYHGCGAGVVQSIFHGGFNRSFFGKNATYYGDGVYFAINASYSASGTYSPPDNNGNKHVFQACVLTGEYGQGKSGLKTPPQKDPSSVVVFDSVVDNMGSPNMFVIFQDAQTYPEYLITFR